MLALSRCIWFESQNKVCHLLVNFLKCNLFSLTHPVAEEFVKLTTFNNQHKVNTSHGIDVKQIYSVYNTCVYSLVKTSSLLLYIKNYVVAVCVLDLFLKVPWVGL